jgi:hypothetical protein
VNRSRELARENGSELVEDVERAAREAGWDGSVAAGVDHVDFARHVAGQARALSWELRFQVGTARWLLHAYLVLGRELASGGLPEYAVDPDNDVRKLALTMPGIWIPQAGIVARGIARWRAVSVIRSCSRLQMAMIRNGVTPVGRATRVRDDGRTRSVYLLVRGEELEREIEKSFLRRDWPRAGGGPSRARAMDFDADYDLGGWSDG